MHRRVSWVPTLLLACSPAAQTPQDDAGAITSADDGRGSGTSPDDDGGTGASVDAGNGPGTGMGTTRGDPTGTGDDGSAETGVQSTEGDTGGPPPPPPPTTGCPHGLTALNWGSGGAHGCARTIDGRAACWQGATGVATYMTFNDGTDLLGGVHQVVAGNQQGCVLLDTGAVHCWGNTNALGIPGAQGTQQYVLSSVPSIAAGAEMLVSGTEHTCALVTDGTTYGVSCWGGDGVGQLGDLEANQQGIRTAALAPTDIPIGLGAGTRTSCAILSDLTMKCWGENQQAQLGLGTMGQPVTTPTLALSTNVVGMSAGSQHSCVLDDRSRTYCWGQNSAGQTGQAEQGIITSSNLPLLDRVVQVAAGGQQTIFLRDDGRVIVIGNGIVMGESAIAVWAGESIACLARGDGTVGCWSTAAQGVPTVTDIAFADDTPVLVEPPSCGDDEPDPDPDPTGGMDDMDGSATGATDGTDTGA